MFIKRNVKNPLTKKPFLCFYMYIAIYQAEIMNRKFPHLGQTLNVHTNKKLA